MLIQTSLSKIILTFPIILKKTSRCMFHLTLSQTRCKSWRFKRLKANQNQRINLFRSLSKSWETPLKWLALIKKMKFCLDTQIKLKTSTKHSAYLWNLTGLTNKATSSTRRAQTTLKSLKIRKPWLSKISHSMTIWDLRVKELTHSDPKLTMIGSHSIKINTHSSTKMSYTKMVSIWTNILFCITSQIQRNRLS